MTPHGTPALRPWLIGILVFMAGVWTLDLAVLRAGVPDPLDDTWEYGVVARALLAGEGFRTRVIHPPLWTLRDAAGTVPVLVHGPLVPLVLAPALAAFGPAALDQVAWVAAAFALVAGLLVFRIGARAFGPAVGAAAAALFTLAPITLHAVNHDPALPIGACLLALALDQVARPRPRAIAAGVALALAWCARPEMLLVAPLLAAVLPRRRVAFLAAFVGCALPWMWHTARAAGTPLFNLSSYLVAGYSEARPGLSVMRDFALPPAAWPEALRRALPGLWSKWAGFLPHALKRALLAPTGATGWLGVLGAGAALARPRRRVVFGALAIGLVPVAVMTLTVYDTRYLVPFLPLWCLAAAFGMATLATRFPAWARRPRAWMGLLLLLVLPSSAPALREEAAGARAFARRLAVDRARLATVARADRAPLFSDTPDFVAWTTGRPVVWLTREEYARLSPAPASAREPLERVLPVRGAPGEAWFHDAAGAPEPVPGR